MSLTAVQCSKRVPVALLVVTNGLGPQLFDSNEYPDTVSDFLDSHLFEDQLITFDEIIAGDIVDCMLFSVMVFSEFTK